MFKNLFFALALCHLSACSWFTSEPSRVDNPVIKGVHYIGISVSDIEKSSRMYQEVFDFKQVGNNTQGDHSVFDELLGRDGTKITTNLLRGANGQVRLMEFAELSQLALNAPRSEVYGTGFTHLCMQVNHATNTYEKFLQRGGQPIGNPEMIQLNPRNPVYYAYARDPDDVMFEIEHVDIAKLELDSPPKNDYRLRHLAIATLDYDSTVAFYSTLFETTNPRKLGRFIALQGEKFDGVSGYKDSKLKMAFFQVRNLEFEVAQYLNPIPQNMRNNRPFDALGFNMIVFDVTSLAAARAKLLEAGGKIVTEPKQMDGGEIFFGRDLDGNLLGFQTLPISSPLSAENFVDNGI